MALFRTIPEGEDPIEHMERVNARVQEKLREKGKTMSSWKQTATKSETSDRELPPAGENMPAVCVALLDVGHHWKEFNGRGYWRHMIFIVWELVDEPERPVVFKDFTLSLKISPGGQQSQLREWVGKWGKVLANNEEFDLELLAGKPCLLSVIHEKTKKDRLVAKVSNLSPARVGNRPIEVAKPEHRPLVWSLEDGKESSLPDWIPWLYGKPIQQWVEESQERSGSSGAQHTERDADPGVNDPAADSIPF